MLVLTSISAMKEKELVKPCKDRSEMEDGDERRRPRAKDKAEALKPL